MVKSKSKLHFAAIGLAILILDSQTASEGASQGIQLCLSTVIPSLFPFIFMSSALVAMLAERSIRIIQRMANMLGMSPESENCFLVGLLGGYPTGAACIAGNYRKGKLEKQQAERMLGFCNNAGPAFLFGIAGTLFPGRLSWIIWLVHILSALLTFLLLPKAHGKTPSVQTELSSVSIASVLIQSVKSMAAICGWIILFRVYITILDKWLLWQLPDVLQITLYGILEISNGCCSLTKIDSSAVRFLLFSCFLAAGGMCVTMQTKTVAAPLSLHWYIAGKGIQCLISMALCGFLIPLLFPSDVLSTGAIFLIVIPSTLIYMITRHFPKKTVDFHSSVLYTKEKSLKR